MDVNVINKEDAAPLVEIFLECILEDRFVEIIYLHGATPHCKRAGCLRSSCGYCRTAVWSINLGELKFSAPQLEALQTALAQPNVTHIYVL
jgi:hypothetical protein